MLKHFFLSIAIVLLYYPISSQQLTPPNDWANQMMSEGKTYEEIKQAFYKEWEGKEYERGKGWKQFHRWENFWETRLMPDGSFPDFAVAFKAYEEYYGSAKSSSQSAMPSNGNWLPMGPFDHEQTGSWSPGTGRVNCVVQDPIDPDIIYIGTPAGGVWKTTDAGANWDPISDYLSVIGISGIAIDPSNTDIIYISTGDADAGDTYSIGIWKSLDGGNTWNQAGSSFGQTNKILVNPDTPSTVWVAGDNGLYKSTNSGDSWVQMLTGNIKDLALKPGSPNTVYAVSSDTFYYTTNGGTSFNTATGLPGGTNRLVIGVTPANPNYVYIVAADGSWGYEGVYRSTDSGNTFNVRNTTTNIFDGSTQAWYDMAVTVDDNNANTLLFGVLNVWKSTDGGTSWNGINSWSNPTGAAYTHADIHYLNYYDGNLYCGSDGGVYKSTNDGGSFTDLTAGVQIGQFYKLGSTPNDVNVISGGLQDNGGYAYTNNSWKCYHGADGMETAVSHLNSDQIFGMIQYGGLYRSIDAGMSYIGEGNPEGGRWITPMQWDPNGNRVICGYNDLHEYNNATDSWNQLSTYDFPALLRNIEIYEDNSDIIYVSSGSDLLRTEDGGISMIPLTVPFAGSITSIEVHPTNSDELWITRDGWTNNGKVYYSSNGGTSWTNISNGLPNLPTNQVKYDFTHDGLYCAMDIGIYYRNSILGTWIPYNDNLPNVIVSDIEINEANSVVRISTYGRGVWESGIYDVPVYEDDISLSAILEPSDVYCGNSFVPEVEIRNVGSNEITSVTINYNIDGGTVSTYNWTGSLSTGDAEIVQFPQITTTAGNHNFEVELLNPNGTADGEPSNNTLINNFDVEEGWLAILTLNTDCWGSETSWILSDSDGLIIDEVSSGTLSNSTSYIWEFCLPEGCYDITIGDTYGDGLNGTAFGCAIDGNYTVTDSEGNILVAMSDPDFDNSIVHNFCLPNGTTGCTDNNSCNFDSLATFDDGSCLYIDECGICGGTGISGCNDPSACNFDPTADCDDGSCTYAPCGTCIGDANLDGVVNILDLVSVSSNIGCTSGCLGNGDANFDTIVDILDTIAVSSNFGIICD